VDTTFSTAWSTSARRSLLGGSSWSWFGGDIVDKRDKPSLMMAMDVRRMEDLEDAIFNLTCFSY